MTTFAVSASDSLPPFRPLHLLLFFLERHSACAPLAPFHHSSLCSNLTPSQRPSLTPQVLFKNYLFG